MKPGILPATAQRGQKMERSTNVVSLRDRFTNSFYKGAAAVSVFGMSVPAFAQVDTTAIETEIGAAKTAGMAVLGAMILAGLAFKAWKLLKRA